MAYFYNTIYDWSNAETTVSLSITQPQEDNDMDVKLTINGTRDTLTTDYKTIKIGCVERNASKWLKYGEGVAETNKYTKDEIEEYREYIYTVKRLAEAEQARRPKGPVVVTSPEEGVRYDPKTHVPKDLKDIFLMITGNGIVRTGWYNKNNKHKWSVHNHISPYASVPEQTILWWTLIPKHMKA